MAEKGRPLLTADPSIHNFKSLGCQRRHTAEGAMWVHPTHLKAFYVFYRGLRETKLGFLHLFVQCLPHRNNYEAFVVIGGVRRGNTCATYCIDLLGFGGRWFFAFN